MWTPCLENFDQVQQSSHIAKKRIATVLFNGTRLHMIDILPQNQKMDTEHFAEHKAYYTVVGFHLLSHRRESPK
jgi:hypothetical protein